MSTKKTAFPPFFDFGRVKYPKSRLSKRLKGVSTLSEAAID